MLYSSLSYATNTNIMKKKMTPAMRLTAKLYFRKLTAASMIASQRATNAFLSLLTKGYWPSFTPYYSGMGRLSNCTKFNPAQTSGSPVRVQMKTTIPVFESGASPSGVEEPTMMEIRSMFIIRLIIKSPPPSFLSLSYGVYVPLPLRIII